MSQLDVRAIVLRTHNDHGISCPANVQNTLITSLENLQRDGQLTKRSIGEVAAKMSSQFYRDNEFDSPAQYGRLLWDQISVAQPTKPQPSAASETHFHGPVTQTGIFQTGAGSTAHLSQDTKILVFRQQLNRALSEAKIAADQELDDDRKTDAVARIEQAQLEAAKPAPDQSKIRRFLKPMLNWTGKRFTNAIDAALGAVINTALKPGQ